MKELPAHLWKKGVSGNPSGRPKAVVDLRELARMRTPKVFEVIDKILASPKSRDADKLRCVEILLDRGYGRIIPSSDMGDLPNVTVRIGPDMDLPEWAAWVKYRGLDTPKPLPDDIQHH